jgi:competence protein ComEA
MQQRALAMVVMAALLGAVIAWWRWPSQVKALDCPGAQVTVDAQGVAHCGPGTPLPAGQALTVGQPLNLNAVTAEELSLLSGVGPQLAQALVEERRRLGGFRTWDQVDAVEGVGPARLTTLQQACVLGPR